jgi:hypothetical protein
MLRFRFLHAFLFLTSAIIAAYCFDIDACR